MLATGSYLGQIRELRVESARGPEVVINNPAFETVRTQVPFDSLAGTGMLLPQAQPFHGASFAPASSTVVRELCEQASPGRAALRIGTATLAPGASVTGFAFLPFSWDAKAPIRRPLRSTALTFG